MSSAGSNTFSRVNFANPEQLKIGIVRSEWHAEIIDKLYDGAIAHLFEHGILREQLITSYVPGSFELPMAAKLMIGQSRVDGIICLGCVIKGETTHDEVINHAIAAGLMQLSLLTNTPCGFGVITALNEGQARERAGGQHGNKGVDAAYAVLSMIALRQKAGSSRSIGFNQ